MSAKAAFPVIRKNSMYDYSVSLKRYHELRNLSHAACFLASQSVVAYERLKMVLSVQDDGKESSGGQKECMRYGPVLPQTAQIEPGELGKVLDPVHVQGRGAPKKRLKPKKRKRSNNKRRLLQGAGSQSAYMPQVGRGQQAGITLLTTPLYTLGPDRSLRRRLGTSSELATLDGKGSNLLLFHLSRRLSHRWWPLEHVKVELSRRTHFHFCQ